MAGAWGKFRRSSFLSSREKDSSDAKMMLPGLGARETEGGSGGSGQGRIIIRADLRAMLWQGVGGLKKKGTPETVGC